MNMFSRRTVLAAGLGAFAGSAATPLRRASAQANYPQRNILLIVAWPPGGVTDVTGRILAHGLSDQLGQPVVVDNRGGASGTIGHTVASLAAPDGYTLLLGTNSTYAMAPYLFDKLPYDNEKAFTPISLIVSSPQILCANPSFAAQNMPAFLDYVRGHKPNEVSFESSGPGSSSHLAMELLMSMANISMLHVPYRGGGPAAQALAAGEVNVGFVDAVVAIPMAQNGQLRMLGISTKERLPLAPDLPTIAESGVPGFQSSTDAALFAPAGTPEPIVRRLSEAVITVLRTQDVKDRLLKLGAVVIGSTPEEFATYYASETAKWRNIIVSRGIKMPQ